MKVVATLKILKLLRYVSSEFGTVEKRGNGKNSQRLPSVLVLPHLRRLVEDVQLRVLGWEHVVHARAETGGFVHVFLGLFDQSSLGSRGGRRLWRRRDFGTVVLGIAFLG